MNVEFRCSHVNSEGLRDCGSRLFALPGTKGKYCRTHPESLYVQTEEGKGPDFLFINEDGKTKSKDMLVGETKERAAKEGEVKGQVEEIAPTGEQVILRGVYRNLTGQLPDLRWGVARLNDEIKDFGDNMRTNQEETTVSEVESAGEANDQENGEDVEEDTGEDESESVTVEPSDKGEIVDEIPA